MDTNTVTNIKFVITCTSERELEPDGGGVGDGAPGDPSGSPPSESPTNPEQGS
jgi:hypothetical protein